MNNEIKEILDYLQESSKKDEATKQLVDYITNLDEKNKELKKKITFNEKSRRKMQQSLMEQIEDYKSRIEKAVVKLKEIKYDLDFEPWSFYDTEGKILFDLVNILNGSDE